MSKTVTLEIPDEVVERARVLAAVTNRRLEEALVEWIGQAVAEPAVETLPDGEVLALCDAKLNESQQCELSELLERHRERELGEAERARLDDLMISYRRGLVLKARAIKEAVARGLKPPLSQDAA